ncbi:Ig-like domain-containing protein [Candidatus Palauibacter sp.]|uniref:Ig-like domain-containing protein n=1 Tax=Candidatus Palauibacter sp. TaxID=3101350 RepID=UPI003D0CEE1E
MQASGVTDPLTKKTRSAHITRARIAIFLFATLVTATWAACGDTVSEPSPPPSIPERSRPTTVAVTPATARLAALGSTVRLSAQVRDQSGQAMSGVAVEWATGNPVVATVDASGLVTAVANGTATVTATAGGASGSATVEVAQEVTAVTVLPSADTLMVGDTLRLSATAEDANGRAVEAAGFVWASDDPSVVAVDTSGLVTAVGAGEVDVVVTASGVTGRARLLVVGVTPATVEVIPDSLHFTALGDTTRLTAQVRDRNGDFIEGAAVSWSSEDPAVATTDASGLVTATGVGQTTVTAATDPAAGTATVTVAPSARTVIVTPPEVTLLVGDTVRLDARATDANGAPIAGAAINWATSDASVATVDPTGLVRALATGTISVTATSGSAWGIAAVTVAADSDRAALVIFFASTGGPTWVNKTNWLTDAPLGDWYGVTVDGTGRVTRLELDANNLSGPIPPAVAHLGQLRHLSLNANSLSGRIPAEVGNLSRLRYLTLRDNALTGEIPRELGRLSLMTTMGLDRNRLTGEIPAEIGGLTRLSWLNLNDNDLTGRIPARLAIPGLSLSVRGNLLHGPIPSTFARAGLESFEFVEPRHRNLYLCVPGTTAFATWAQRVAEPDPRFCNESDRVVLQSFHQVAGGSTWTDSDRWLAGPAIGEWYGVESDSLGRVVALDLANNGLSGELPAGLGHLAALTELDIAGNPLTGRLPASLTVLSLQALRYSGTGLCVPAEPSFRSWLTTVPVHEGTGVECAATSDKEILEILYRATDGPNWTLRNNWLTDAPLEDWHGVEVDAAGRVVSLHLAFHNLNGVIPPEIGQLDRLVDLQLFGNPLRGPIPSELGDLSNLRRLYLFLTELSGTIPPELGRLSALEELSLQRIPLAGPLPPELGNLSRLRSLFASESNLSGPLPPELGRLSQLEELSLFGNHFSGSIPGTFGNLTRLSVLELQQNRLTGPLPAELGALSALEFAWLQDNKLTGALPPALGGLSSARALIFTNNDLSGGLPATFGELSSLEYLNLTNNRRMSGVLPRSLQALDRLNTFHAGGTGLCAPGDVDFQGWLATVTDRRVRSCAAGGRSRAYLTQAVQSLDYPVSLVANEPALLRVFVTARMATNATFPPVRARFYNGGAEVHLADIPAGSGTIPVEIEEGELSKSANALVPGQVVTPGLEMVVEIDPDGILDPGLDVQRRIPESGRASVAVASVPALQLTWIPMVSSEEPDSSVVELSEGLTEESPLLWEARMFMPINELDLTVHETVSTSTRSAFEILRQVEAIRVMEGGTGYYMGVVGNLTGAVGVAERPGRSSVVSPGASVVAHELGHNLSLAHAPCGGAPAADASFPTPNASIGVWGYDFRDDGGLVSPAYRDLMSYCHPRWISDYSFSKALFYRLRRAGARGATAPDVAPGVEDGRSLLLWGGLDQHGEPVLEPAFVVDAPPALPASTGAWQLRGVTVAGGELFSLRFDMRETTHGAPPFFVFALPAQPEWAGRLARITLTGPAGSVSLEAESDRPMTVMRDTRTGRVLGILRGRRAEAGARDAMAAPAEVASALEAGLEALFSRGIPELSEWRR